MNEDEKRELKTLILTILEKMKELKFLLNINEAVIKECSKNFSLIIDLDNYLVLDWGKLES